MHYLDRRKHCRGQAVVLPLAVLSFTMAGAGLGFWIGKYSETQGRAIDSPPLGRVIASNHGPSFGPAMRASTRSGSPVHSDRLNAVAVDLDEMRAELMRLNALGARLVQMAGLDAREFDFDNPPPRGGPETGPVRDYTIKELAKELGGVIDLIQDRQRKLDLIGDNIKDRQLTARARPSGWPVGSGYISSRYGFRMHPIKKVRRFHEGVDFSSPRGTPIVAVADGVVTFSGRKRGYGRVIDIRHANGLVTRYAHNAANLVKNGQKIGQGQQIATVGSSGYATGPHVHFEVRKGDKPVDPMRYLGSATRPTLAGKGGGFAG